MATEAKPQPKANDRRKQYMQRWGSLDTEFASWRTHAEAISKFLLPRSGRYLSTDRNRGERKHHNILDSSATRALRVLGAGLLSGATSPARPWFRLTMPDQSTGPSYEVKRWLNQTRDDMLNVFQRSNLYRVLHSMYEELGAFGTAAAIVVEDMDRVIHLHHLTYGEYRISTNNKGRVDTLAREFDMKVHQIVEEYGFENCSVAVQNMYNSGNLDAYVTVIHIIQPRKNYNPDKRDAQNMPFESVHFEKGSNEDKFLRESGYRRFRCLVPRWQVSGGDIYGNAPGHEALGDIKQLQHEQLMKGKAIDFQVDPPLLVPASMRNREIDRLPGGVMYYSDYSGAKSPVSSAFDVNLRLDYLLADIEDVRERIRQSFYSDLFLMLANDDKTGRTATEIAERNEEKLLMLGPVLERIHDELLNELIDITFEFMMEQGRIAPPPPELDGTELKVEYVSMLAQAQRAISTTAMDRALTFTLNIAQMKPQAVYKFNELKALDSYFDMLGVDPEILHPDDVVQQQVAAENARAQQIEQAQIQAEQAKAAQSLGNIATDTPNAFTDATNLFSGYSSPIPQ